MAFLPLLFAHGMLARLARGAGAETDRERLPPERPRAARWTRIAACCLGLGAILGAPRTARAAEPFFFIQLSDPQFGFMAANANFEQETVNFEFAVATVNRLRPAFVVITGDLVHKTGDEAQMAEYRRIVRKVDSSIPVYDVAGNHDVGNEPTTESIQAYNDRFGPDHYAFRNRGLVGIVLNSSLIFAPAGAPARFAEQERWLESELEKTRQEGARHVVVFQHHSLFLKSAGEPDTYSNLPLARRAHYMGLFGKYGVKYVFCGHYHRNAVARDGQLEVVTTGPIGKPLGPVDERRSGLRVVIVRDDRIDHEFYDFSRIPNQITLEAPPAKAARPR